MENFLKLNIKELEKLNAIHCWSLNTAELNKAREYFEKEKRNPSRAEMETIAQTWSEHCKHKTFSGPVRLNYKNRTYKFKNLFKETIVYATKKLNKKWCLSVFKDNAGVVELAKGSKWAIAFKAETHNHPCAVEPYGGAETGVGGVIRDILGVGLGAKPVLNTDNFCFAPPSKRKTPKGFLSPEKIFDGVTEGVRDYGNRMGIPTAAGGIYFDEGYFFNPLVYVGSAGIIEKKKIFKKVKKGDLIVSLGGPTGRDGIHGATFSSADMDENTSSSAVQVGHAINEKKVLDAVMKAKKLNLYNAITDCGAGGFSSAIGELGEETGVKVFLDRANLKDSNIKPWEIWVSESQERMILSVPKKNIKKLESICEIENCPICVLGEFDGAKRLKVYFKEEILIDLDMKFLHGGLPSFEKKAEFKKVKAKKQKSKRKDYGSLLKKIISDINVCSKRSVISQYDHEVQGGTVLKPFSGKGQKTPADACVIWPHSATGEFADFNGFAVSHGMNVQIGKIDPYKMSFYAIDEAMRALVCVGADISKTAILDNFCCANPKDKKVLGAFALAAMGCKDAALLYKTPFISGKDSFYNQTSVAGKDYAIPLSLLISALACVEDVRKTITPEFKETDNSVYLIGKFNKGLGASVYSAITGLENNELPDINPKKALKNYLRLYSAIKKGFIVSAHDVSKGGIAVALAKMSFSGFSCFADLTGLKSSSHNEALFSEAPSLIIVEVKKSKEKEFVSFMKGADILKLGFVKEGNILKISRFGKNIIEENIEEMFLMWENALERKYEKGDNT